jgi:hypothetical protein
MNMIYRNNQSGQVVMAAVLVFMTLSLVVVIGISAPIASQIRNSTISLESRKTVTTSEVLNDDALYRLNSGRSLPSTMVLSLNQSTSTATITDVGTSKQIITEGVSKSTARSTSALFAQGGSAAPISHALHTGIGGLQITGGSRVTGNVFANGIVLGYGGGNVVGSVTAASTLNETLIVDNTDTGTIYGSIDVGKVNNIQQIGQSFTVATTTPITAFSLYIKKTGAPANGILRIFNSTGGGSNVGTSQIGSTGALSAASVTNTYGWVDIYPYAPITLTPGTTYYLTLEAQGSNSSNYYTLATNDGVYTGGISKTRTKTGTSWAAYVNASPASQDYLFGAYVGGVTYISGNGWDKFEVTGSANAGTVNSTDATGAIYCQNGNMNNKPCDMTQPIPTATPLPIFDDRIATWKANASAGTVRSSSWTITGGVSTSTPGPMRINGDLRVTGGSDLTLNGPLYVTGTILVEGGTEIKLAPGYGATDEYVVAGYIRTTGGGVITGSGTAGSYIVIATDSSDTCTSLCDGSTYAVKVVGGTESMVLVAPNGTLYASGGADLNAAMAKTIIMDGGSNLTYEAALATITFSSTGSGWSVQSWKER